jgi:hypothetical protein
MFGGGTSTGKLIIEFKVQGSKFKVDIRLYTLNLEL